MLELQYSSKELYEVLRRRVESFNCKLETILGERKYVKSLDPGANEVSFCSGIQGWGFTLNRFARFYLVYRNKHTYDAEKQFTKILWSSKYYCTSDDPFDPNCKFEKIKEDGIPEGKYSLFEVYVLHPIYKVRDMCMSGDTEGIISYLAKFGVDFKNVELSGSGKSLFKVVFKYWLPATETLLEQVITKLPSPKQSQAFRVKHLYTGPTDDPVYMAIASCDTTNEATVTVYISMVPDNANGFIAFGGVLSGNIKPGTKVYVQDPNYVPDPTSTKRSPYICEKIITKVLIVNPRGAIPIRNCPAGNIVGLVGAEGFLKKTGTITTAKNCYNIKTMKFSVSPVVKVAVSPKRSADLNHFKEGLEKLAKSDPLCLIEYNESGQATIACAGELHLEIILGDLKNFYAKCEFTVETPQVRYYEGFSDSVTKARMRKSANKHNRVYMTCEPPDDEIVDNIPALMAKDSKEIAAKFRELLNRDDEWIKNIMYFGPEAEPLNILVDETKGIQYMMEVKEHIFEGFKHATKEGPMVGECIRAGKFNLVDLSLHADSIHRGANQMIRPVEDLVRGLILIAEPVLYEPIFTCN